MTGTHPVTQEEVMAWLDGELPTPRADEIAGHVESCADCGALASDLRAVSDRVAVWTVEPPPAEWRAGMHGAIGPMAAATSRRLQPRRILLAVAVAATVVLAIMVPLTRRLVVRSDQNNAISVELGHAEPSAPAPRVDAQRVLPSLGYVSRPGDKLMGAPQPSDQPSDQRMIARTVTLSLTTERFDDIRTALERATAAEGGSVVSLASGGEPRRRTLRATVRVPAARLDAALVAFRALGVLKNESLATDDVTDSYRDLTIRIRNARVEEQRLVELLKSRTGTVKDVLDVEREIARVRSQAERMAAEAETTRNRAAFSLVTVEVDETYRAELTPASGDLPVLTRLRNAFIDGVLAAEQSMVGVALGVAQFGPTLIAWSLLLVLPAWWTVRWLRGRVTHP
jgi:Domain of unknown function (DUF4349)/Putative zinc-finger